MSVIKHCLSYLVNAINIYQNASVFNFNFNMYYCNNRLKSSYPLCDVKCVSMKQEKIYVSLDKVCIAPILLLFAQLISLLSQKTMAAQLDTNPNYKGLFDVLNPVNPEAKPAPGEIEDDIEGEQETIPESTAFALPDLLKTLAEASKGVSDKTDREYLKYVYLF